MQLTAIEYLERDSRTSEKRCVCKVCTDNYQKTQNLILQNHNGGSAINLFEQQERCSNNL